MSLVQSFEKSGNLLFKYRGQIPMILFLVVIPVLYFSDTTFLDNEVEMAIKIGAILICALGLGIRIFTVGTAADFTSGRNREQQVAESLNTTGIYSIVRHPLYLGNYLMWAGIMIYTLSLSFFIIISLLYWIYYERIMFAEERFLERKFNDDFIKWSNKTPAFVPAFNRYIPSKYTFNSKKIVKEYSGILSAVISFVFIETLQYYFRYDEWFLHPISIIALSLTLLLVVVLKFIVQPRISAKQRLVNN